MAAPIDWKPIQARYLRLGIHGGSRQLMAAELVHTATIAGIDLLIAHA